MATFTSELATGCIVTLTYDPTTLKLTDVAGVNNSNLTCRIYILSAPQRTDVVGPGQSVSYAIPKGQQPTFVEVPVAGKPPMFQGVEWRVTLGL